MEGEPVKNGMLVMTKWRKDITYTKFAVVLDGLLIIFLDIIGEVVDRNVIVLNVLHDLDRR